jgi:transcription initiation factor TFIID subunit 6
MSFIQPAAISAIAHSVDVPRLSDEAAKALAPDVEYRLREIIQVHSQLETATGSHLAIHAPLFNLSRPPQEAQKFAKHAKRTAVTTEDIKQALRLRNADVGGPCLAYSTLVFFATAC